MRQLFWVVIAVIAVAIAVQHHGGSSTSPPDDAAIPLATNTPTPDMNLATLQSGIKVTDDMNPLAERFQGLLAELAPSCQEGPTRLAVYTERSHDILAQSGISESYMSVLTHVIGSIPANLAPTRCADIFALYVTLRKRG